MHIIIESMTFHQRHISFDEETATTKKRIKKTNTEYMELIGDNEQRRI